MADLTALMSQPLDEVEALVCPEGHWRVEAMKGSLGDIKQDKNGNDYQIAKIILRPMEVVDVADEAAAEKFLEDGGADESRLFFDIFINDRNSIVRTRKALEALDVPLAGRQLDEALAEISGGFTGIAEVVHEEYQGRLQVKVKSVVKDD